MKALAGLATAGFVMPSTASSGEVTLPVQVEATYLFAGEEFDTMDYVAPVYIAFLALFFVFLLACVAAKRGLTSILGPKRKIESHIASFPKGIYLSKSLRIARRNFFAITRMLGHEIVAWDEEALVHLPPETYYSRRLSPVGMEHVSHMFAWGEENVELWRQYSKLPPEMPIHATRRWQTSFDPYTARPSRPGFLLRQEKGWRFRAMARNRRWLLHLHCRVLLRRHNRRRRA